MNLRIAPALLAALACLLLAACGGGGGDSTADTPADPVEQVPDTPGLQERVREALKPDMASFPKPEGKSLQEVADLVGAGPTAALATSVLTEGDDNRLTFGVISQDGTPIYGPTAVYIAPTPEAPAQGPFAAPADVLLTQDRYKSKQAAMETDPFAAVYAATGLEFDKAGTWAVLVATRSGGRLVGAPTQIPVKTKNEDKIPDVGEPAPKTDTDTLESVKGDKALLDTRDPASDMHSNYADVIGKKPIALLFSTPALCESRVCGPVTDVALQMRAKYGDDMAFIHQEVFVNNKREAGPAAAAAGVQPAERAVAVRDRQARQGDGAARGLLRRRRVRGRDQDRVVRRAAAVLTAAVLAAALIPSVAHAHGLVQRQQLPIPQWLLFYSAAAVLVISFFALAVLWPKPRLEEDAWRPLPGGRVIASAPVQAPAARSASACWS